MISASEAKQETLKQQSIDVEKELEEINKEIQTAISFGKFNTECHYIISAEAQKQLKKLKYKIKERFNWRSSNIYYIISWRR